MLGGDHVEPVERPVELVQRRPAKRTQRRVVVVPVTKQQVPGRPERGRRRSHGPIVAATSPRREDHLTTAYWSRDRADHRDRSGRTRAGQRTTQAHRRALRPLRGRRAPSRLAAHDRPARPPGARGPVRVARRRGGAAGDRRHPVAHLLDDQADHLGRRDDPVRGGQARAHRPGQRIHSCLQRRPRLRRRLGPEAGDRPRRRAGQGLAPAHAHGRAHLRLPPGAPGGRAVPRGRVRVGHAARRGPGPGLRHLGHPPAAVPAGGRMELLGRHRRPRPRRRGGLRTAARRLPRAADLPPPRHDRHRLLG